MADTTALKNRIRAAIKANDNQEITGPVLQQALLDMVDELNGATETEANARQSGDSTLQQAINSEAQTRQSGDSTLQQAINSEAQTRQSADTQLNNLITNIKNNIDNGYVYAGIATPSSTPASGKVFYLALTAGTYTNFGNTAVAQGINILKYNGSAWSLDAFIGIDDAPTPSSNNLVKSGGAFDEVMKNGSAFDLSAYNGGATYADLNAALTALNALPAAYKRGGMSVKYVSNSDNNYIQARCIANEFTTDVTKWQVVDDEVTNGSNNLITSGAVYEEVEPLKDKTQDITHEDVVGGSGERIVITDNNDETLTEIETGEEVADGDAIIITDDDDETLARIGTGEEVGTKEKVAIESDNGELLSEFNKEGTKTKNIFTPKGSLLGESKPIRFILVTDNHYLYDNGARVRDSLNDEQRTQMMFDMIKDEMKYHSIDFVISTGDSLQDGMDENGVENAIKFRENFLSQLAIPYFACVGNHDLYYSDNIWEDTFYHKRNFSFECKDLYFICPNMYSNRILPSGGYADSFNDYIGEDYYYDGEHHTYATDKTYLQWMNEEAAKARKKGKRIIIALHWFRRIDSVNQYNRTNLSGVHYRAGETVPNEVSFFTNWCKENNVECVLIGHQHGIENRLVNGVRFICAGWFAYRSDPYQMKSPWGINLIELNNGKTTATQITREWRYSKRFEGDTTVIGDNMYAAYSRVTTEIGENGIYDSADYNSESQTNNAFCKGSAAVVPDVPSAPSN